MSDDFIQHRDTPSNQWVTSFPHYCRVTHFFYKSTGMINIKLYIGEVLFPIVMATIDTDDKFS